MQKGGSAGMCRQEAVFLAMNEMQGNLVHDKRLWLVNGTLSNQSRLMDWPV